MSRHSKLLIALVLVVAMTTLGISTVASESRHAPVPLQSMSFEAKYVLVYVKQADLNAVLHSPTVVSIGDRSFLRGTFVKSDFTSKSAFSDRVFMIPISDIQSIVVFDNKDQIQ